ncbi:MAG: hypothetical protein A2Y57_04230 [Candidatus Woykebacteria bacterium RBG_13_40_7b]|uniref:Uncharacterized protein n=1 Tax=Candidatus Woykebacteria bacterium RBG_13_40_7b TaxID=1802594 RepID=A0A1G1W9B6_9BACT|nr:MAG: hypothetical protein A2Y57_04230 [Candidatus Woykebacteria bacterium RBG_13_40_7b]
MKLSIKEREKVFALERRAKHLKQRINLAETEGRHLSYDRQEFASLLWALEIIKEHFENYGKDIDARTGTPD